MRRQKGETDEEFEKRKAECEKENLRNSCTCDIFSVASAFGWIALIIGMLWVLCAYFPVIFGSIPSMVEAIFGFYFSKTLGYAYVMCISSFFLIHVGNVSQCKQLLKKQLEIKEYEGKYGESPFANEPQKQNEVK